MPHPSPLILAIETSNPSAADGGSPGSGVAVGRFSEPAVSSSSLHLLASEPLLTSTGRGGHDDDLMPAIDRLFTRLAINRAELAGGLVAVSIGPGGFTGLRVACATGKLIAEALAARAVAVPSAAVVALNLDPTLWSAGAVAIALASKGEEAWIQTYTAPPHTHPDQLARTDGRLLTAADLPTIRSSGVRTLVADRFFPAAFRHAATAAGLTLLAPTFTPEACATAGLMLPPIDPLELNPLYPREPDAVRLWREKHKAASD